LSDYLAKTLLLHFITLLCWNSQANSMCIRYLPTNTPIDPCFPLSIWRRFERTGGQTALSDVIRWNKSVQTLRVVGRELLVEIIVSWFLRPCTFLHFLSSSIHVLRLVLFRYAASISALGRLQAHLHGHSSQWWTFYSHCLILPKPILCWSDMNTKHWKFWECWMVSFFMSMWMMSLCWLFFKPIALDACRPLLLWLSSPFTNNMVRQVCSLISKHQPPSSLHDDKTSYRERFARNEGLSVVDIV
jgi:hypothetical protein